MRYANLADKTKPNTKSARLCFIITGRDYALDFCKAICAYFFFMPCKSLRSSLKTTPRVVFLTRRGSPKRVCEFWGSTCSFESLREDFYQNKRAPEGALLFWWTSRDCALDFCKAICAHFFLVPCKSLRSSLKTTPRVVFLTRRGSPKRVCEFWGSTCSFESLREDFYQNKRAPEGALLFWWTSRDSNPGPTGYEPVALTN